MAQPYVGDIRMFGGNFAPRNYALCNGQLLPIAQYQELFALIGTTFGGDGQNTFGVPDLRGRVPVHQGQGPALPATTLGETAGTETVTLNTNQIPAHPHPAGGGGAATSSSPTGNLPGVTAGGGEIYAAAGGTVVAMAAAVGPAGGNQPHENVMPFQAISFIIALYGVFPARN